LSNYEVTYILRPLEEANITTNNERINTIIQNAGGEIVARNDWGRRRLAYPIQKIHDGYYTTLFIELPGSAVRSVERSLELTEDVLRYLVVRVDTHTLPAPQTAPATPTAAPADASAAPAATSEAAPVAAAPDAAAPTSEAAPVASTEAAPATPEATPATSEAQPAATETAPAPQGS
jgi:small subunit ribosomal protein S6